MQCRRRTQTCRHCWVSACHDAIAAAGCCCLVLAVQLMWAAISIVGMMFMQPTDPSKTNPRTVVQLQQFCWTEAALEESIKVTLPVPRSFKDAWHAFLEGHSSSVQYPTVAPCHFELGFLVLATSTFAASSGWVGSYTCVHRCIGRVTIGLNKFGKAAP